MNQVQNTDVTVDDGDEQHRVITDRLIGWILTIGGLTGALAAFVLTVEKIALLKNPAYVPSCSINPILSFGSIMTTQQAEVFGFANPLIGLSHLSRRGGHRRCRARPGPATALVVARPARRHPVRRRVRALAVRPEPVPHRRTLPLPLLPVSQQQRRGNRRMA